MSPLSGKLVSRVPTPPGKSCNCVCKISRNWKVLENEFGPGKFWKSKCKVFDNRGILLDDADAKDAKPKYARLHTSIPYSTSVKSV